MVEFDTKRNKLAAKSYWQTYLQDYSPASLTRSDLAMSGALEMISTPRIITSISALLLSRFAQKRNVAPVVIMQAAWATLLYKAMGTDDVAFGVVVSGRNVEVDGITEMTGNFLNTVPLRITTERNSGCDLWLQNIHQSSIGSIEHHHLSLEEIIRQSGSPRIFETVMIFENHADQIEQSAFGVLHLLRYLSKHSDCEAGLIRAEQLQNANSDTLVSLFATAARAFPETIAVEEDASSVTFSVLSERADTVSDFLVQANVCTGHIVLIIFSHSTDMIVAMLGIMKAGAAYCPIDIESPERKIRHVVEKVLSPDACPSLKTLVLGGERLPPILRDRWADRVKLYDGYGPTECAVQVSTALVDPLSDVGVISTPLPGNMTILVGSQGEILRIGEICEICVGGLQVFSGYLGEPEAMEKDLPRILEIEFPLFATSDLGRCRPGMTIELLGRKDGQVKLSGERVEVEEIESIICSFEAVKRCAVLVERNQLYAVVEGKEEPLGRPQMKSEDGVWTIYQNAIAQKFKKVEGLDEVAVKNALSPETEHSIASMVAKISGYRPKNPRLPLHHSGLNSLNILHLRSSMAKRYGLALDLTKFWLAGSIRSLANLVDDSIALSQGSRGKKPEKPQLPLAIYFLHHIPSLLYGWRKTAIQIAHTMSAEYFASETLIILAWDSEDVVAQVRTICGDDYKIIFDLESGPLARLRLFASNGRDYYLYYNIHHVLVDEWTCDKVVTAVLKEYRGFPWRDTIDPSWNTLTTTLEYESRKTWLRGNADMETRASASTSVFKAPIEVLRKLRLELNNDLLSLFIVLLSAFQVLLHQYTTFRSLIVLIPVSRRGFDVRSMNAIGNMTYTAAVSPDVEPGDTFVAFGERTANSVSFARENSFVPIDKILNTVSSAVTDHSVMFVYNKEGVSHGPTKYSDLSTDVLPQALTMFDITLNVTEDADQLAVTLRERYGIVSGDIVPIFVNQTPDLLAAVIGILKVGAGYKPEEVSLVIFEIAHIKGNAVAMVEGRLVAFVVYGTSDDPTRATPADQGDASDDPEDEYEQKIHDICLQAFGVSISATANLLDHGLDSAASDISKHPALFPRYNVEFGSETAGSQDVFQDATYNVPGLFEIQDVSLESVRVALNTIIAEHSIFRTCFEFDSSKGYQQVVMQDLKVNIAEYDLRLIESVTMQAQMQHVLRSELEEPFNIATLPLIRCNFFRKLNGMMSVFINFHYSIMDEQSLRIFMTELSSKLTMPTPMTSPSKIQTAKDVPPAVLIPISQRLTNWGETYGCFLNTVPIHSPIDASSSLESAIENSNQILLDVMENSFVPYESILDAFPVMFVYHEDNSKEVKIFNDTSHVVRSLSNSVKPKFPLTFSVTVKREQSSHALELNVDYDTSKVSTTVIQSLCDHYKVLLSAPKTSKNAAVGELEIITEKERNLLRQRQENPEGVACWFEAYVKTTYQDLWTLVECITELLSSYYSQKNGRVAIFMGPGVERIASAIGTLKAGFAYVPLDTEWPALRIAAVLQDSAPEVILVSSNGATKFPQTLNDAENIKPVISEPYILSHGKKEPKRLQTPSIDALDLAYILAMNLMGITHLAITPTISALLSPDNSPTLETLAIGDSNVSIIRKPLRNVMLYISNDQLQEVPLGSIGQLAVGEVQLCGNLLIVLGDLARFTDDGSVYCFRRRDNQVKLRGQRIELEEIEKLISSVQEIQWTIVSLIKTEQVEVICATLSQAGPEIATRILKLDKQTTDLASGLNDLVGAHLPQYVVPRYWVPLSRVPSDANGKIDRSSVRTAILALSKDELALPDEALTKFLLTDANRKIGIEPVDILLASLLWAFQRWKAIRQIELCLESHGRDLKDEFLDVSRTVGWFTSMINVLFSIPTATETQLDELIAEVKDCRSFAMGSLDLSKPFADRHSEVPVITFNYHGSYSTTSESDVFDLVDIGEVGADEDPLNLRFAAIDIGCGINNGVLALSIIYSTSIDEKSEADILLQLWSNSLKEVLDYCKRDMNECILTSRELPSLLLQRHQIAALVRSSLKPVGIEPSMIENIILATDMQKSMVFASQEFGSYIESFTYSIHGIFEVDLPTMQIFLYQAANDSFQFIWGYHHAFIDGWSAGIVMRDFQLAYLARLLVAFDKVRSKMADFARDKQIRNFWNLELEGAHPNRLFDRSRPRASQDGRSLDWRYDQSLPAWTLALAYFYGEEGIIFGATISGRNTDVSGIEKVVGPCINTVPFRIRVDSRDSRESYLRKVHLKSALLVENDGISLRKIYEISGKKDLFDTTFVCQNYAKFPLDPDLPFSMELLKANETTDIPLNVMVSQNNSGRLHVAALLHGEQHSPAFLDNLFAAFAAALTWVCGQNSDGSKIKDLAMLSPAAQQHVEDISRGPMLQEPNLTVWQLFAHKESQIPEKTALEFYIGEKIEA
ncbi:hypothetical protein B7494_g6435 [Chlorociboria aeruginascens]|nr:hypothetical protein B7494_g6435 [Chlorociboria aeruginascens]